MPTKTTPDQPLISVLIPVYNRENYISECIQSALDQDYPNIEIIVVDNASTDRTWRFCQEISEKDKRVRIFRNSSNIGPVRNWLRAAHEANGEFAKILFSDDLLLPGCLSTMAQCLLQKEVGLVYCSILLGTDISRAAPLYNNKDEILDSANYTRMIINGKAPISPGGILLRTSDILKFLLPDIPTALPHRFDMHGAGPDVMLSLLTARAYPSVASISRQLVFFRAHPNSISVVNKNNEVSNGYQAAFSHYLKNYGSHQDWLDYTSRQWIKNTRRQRHWIDLQEFLTNHEGNGDTMEKISFFLALISKPFRKHL